MHRVLDLYLCVSLCLSLRVCVCVCVERERDCFGSLTPEARKHLSHPR